VSASVDIYIKTLLDTVLSPSWPAGVQVVFWLRTVGSYSSHSIEVLFLTPIQLENTILRVSVHHDTLGTRYGA
jgi:hypothetical protein